MSIDSDSDNIPDYHDDCPQNTPMEIFNGVDKYGCPLSMLAENNGTFIASSACKISSNDEEYKGIFTQNILKTLSEKGKTSIEEVFNEVNQSVSQETNNTQNPWYKSTLKKKFTFEENKNVNKIALVIGNSKYPKSRNTTNVSMEIGKKLYEFGFETIFVKDANYQSMKDAIKKFEHQLSKEDGKTVGFFYFSGDGVNISENNLILPIKDDKEEYNLKNVIDLKNDVLEKMKKASNGVNIIVIDACRGNFDKDNALKPIENLHKE